MVKSIHGTYKITYHPDGPEGEGVEIDFTPPFRRVKMIPTLEEALKVKFPAADDLVTEAGVKFLSDLCVQKGERNGNRFYTMLILFFCRRRVSAAAYRGPSAR